MMWGAAMGLVAFVQLACDGDGGGGPPGPSPSIQVSVSPSVLAIEQGGSGVATLTLVRSGGFSAPVTVTVEGLPSGIAASIVPSSLTGTTANATVTVTVASTVVPGTHTATIRASASGVGDATATCTVTVTAAPSYTLSVAPTALTVQQGASGNATVSIARVNFTGAVGLALRAPPAGVTGSFIPASATGDQSALTISVAGAVAPGNYPLTVTGTATGLSERTTTLSLTVAALPSSIAIAVTPQVTSVVQGGAGEAFVSIARTNFAGAVALAASGMPSGVTVAFDQTPTTANQMRLTYAATSSAALGTHQITVTASATGVATATATLSLQVVATGGSQVEFQFCSASDNPVFFAYQDGAGAWQAVTGTLSLSVYRYQFTLAQPWGGVFFVQQSGQALLAASYRRVEEFAQLLLPSASVRTPLASVVSAVTGFETSVMYGTVAELASLGLGNCQASLPTKSVWLSVAGVGGAQQATLSLGDATEFFIGGVDTSPVQLTGVRGGLVDFFGTRQSILTGVPNKLYDARNLNPADGSTLPFVSDFNSASAYDPASAQLTIVNALGDDLLTFASFFTVNGEAGLLGGSLAPSTAVTRNWYGVPSSRLLSGDVHSSIVYAAPAVTTTDEVRYQIEFVSAVQNLAPVLGARLPTPTASSVGSPAYRRIRVQGALPGEYADAIVVMFGPTAGGNEIAVLQTGAHLLATGGAAAYDLAIPDLTALAGFPLSSGLPAGEIESTVSVAGWTGTGVTSPLPVSGNVLQGAAKTVKLVVP